jgi:CLIP-associating protein 1/2
LRISDNLTFCFIQLKTFRSLCCDSAHHAQIVAYLRHLGPPLQSAVKDLRSQLGREACISVAHIAEQLGLRAEFLFEPMLPALFSLLVANAKVVSITGSATLILVYESIPSWRLLPPLQSQMLSKSKEVRRAVCSCIKIVLHQWPPPTIQKHAHIINDVMKKVLYKLL